MIRLTKSIREKMAVALTRHKMNEQAEVLMAESVALFQAVYDHEYPDAVRKAMAAVKKLRPKAFGSRDNLVVNLRGQRFSVGCDRFGVHGILFIPKCPNLPVLDDIGWSGVTFTDGDLADRLEKFSTDRAAFVTELSQSYKKAVATLGSFTTGKKLAEEWPEAMPIIGDMIPEDSKTVPAVQLGDFNKDFGLPPSERQAA